MSNTITAYFKGRVGVCESLYQYDYGRVMILDDIDLPSPFDAYFETTESIEAIPVIGQYNRVAIPDDCLTRNGVVTLHIPVHTGQNDSEVEYKVSFRVVGRARPIDDEDPSELQTAVSQAIALLQHPNYFIEHRLARLQKYKVNTPLDEHGQPYNGEAGQMLRTKGNGATEWVYEGTPTDEQTAQAVSDWLAVHPEATTTVQDGAITPVKLNTELLKRYKESGSVLFLFPDLSAGGYSGNCSLVVTPSKTILMDCGPDTDWLAIKAYFDVLYTEGIFSNIDEIVISHYHYDHIEGLDDILSTYPHENCHVYLPMNPSGYSADSETIQLRRSFVIDTLTEYGVPYTEISEDTDVVIDQDFITLKLFNSSASDYAYYSEESSVYNNYCMVALYEIGNVYAMFPGDIQADAQVRIMAQHELPRLFLYCVHHHGIQNDDYRPYLEAIDPQYSIIMTSHNRALLSAASSYSGNYLSGDVGSTGFSSYAYVCGKDGGSIVDGLTIPKIGWYYSYVDLYVNNEYVGDIHDGTEDHPFTEINEALMFVNQSSNLHYRIYVKGTQTKYGYIWLRDVVMPLEIIGQQGANDEYPSIHGAYVRNCNNAEISRCVFDGDGRNVNSAAVLIYNWASNLALNNCTLDGTNIQVQGSNAKTAIQLRESHLYLTSCTIKNLATGVSTYREGECTSNNNTFENVATMCYGLGSLSLIIKGQDVLTNTSRWMTGNPETGIPFVIAKNKVKSALLSKNSASAVSMPFYYDSSNPACICAGTKVYNLLTGAEVTIS